LGIFYIFTYMKKIILTLLIIFLFLDMYPQKFGIKNGLSISNILTNHNSGAYKNQSKLGYQISVFTINKLTEKIQIQPSISFIPKGTINKYPNPSFPISWNGDINWEKSPTILYYLDGAIDIAYKLNNRTQIFTGPYLGFLIYASRKENIFLDDLIVNTVDLPVTHQNLPYNRIDLGINIGSSITINEKVYYELKYSLGLTSISGDYLGNPNKQLNVCLSLSVGYILN